MDTSPAVLEDTEEQSIDKELSDYGLLEQGMALEEKKDLLLVIKNSESTALADEHRRVSLGLQNTSNNTSNQIDGDSKNNNNGLERSEVSALECFSHEETSFQALTEQCSIVDNVPQDSNDSNDSHNAHSPKQKGATYSTSKFTPKTSRLSLKSRIVDDEQEDIDDCVLSNNSPKCKSPFQDLFEDNTNAKLHSIEDSICLKNDLPPPIRKKEDRKRNIDVFNAVKDRNEQTLMRSKQFKIVGKTPYYVVPNGMDVKDFTIYFKEQLAAIATNLIASQSKSLKLVPWGDPVIVSNLENIQNSNSNNTFEEIIGPADSDIVNPIAQNQRYNFRGRTSKRKCQDDIFNLKLSDEETSEDDIFIKKASAGRPKISERTKTPTYSGSSAKRKSIFGAVGEHLGEKEVDESTDSTFILNKERLNDRDTDKDSVSEDETKNKSGSARIKNICKSGILRTKEADEHSSQSNWEPLQLVDDDDEDYEVGQEINIPKRKIPKSNSKLHAKNKKKVSKPIPLEHRDSQEESKDREIRGVSKHPNSLWLNTTLFDGQDKDLSVIKPLPINPRMRKLKRPNSGLGRTKKKVTKLTSQEVDEIILPIDPEESDTIPIQMDEHTACPICEQIFNINEIQDHAADCYKDADDVAENDVKTTSRCPICVESFPTGSIFESHAKCCQVKKRLVRPPVVGPTARNKSKT